MIGFLKVINAIAKAIVSGFQFQRPIPIARGRREKPLSVFVQEKCDKVVKKCDK